MAYDKYHRPLLYVSQVPGEAELRTCDLTAQLPFPLLQVSSLIFRQQSCGSRQTTHDKYQVLPCWVYVSLPTLPF